MRLDRKNGEEQDGAGTIAGENVIVAEIATLGNAKAVMRLWYGDVTQEEKCCRQASNIQEIFLP
jgi:hypothetical protein